MTKKVIVLFASSQPSGKIKKRSVIKKRKKTKDKVKKRYKAYKFGGGLAFSFLSGYALSAQYNFTPKDRIKISGMYWPKLDEYFYDGEIKQSGNLVLGFEYQRILTRSIHKKTPKRDLTRLLFRS